MSSDHALLPADAQSSADAGATEFQEHGLQRQLSGFALKFVGVAALLFSTYQLTVAAFAPLSSLITRSLHVGFLLMRLDKGANRSEEHTSELQSHSDIVCRLPPEKKKKQ